MMLSNLITANSLEEKPTIQQRVSTTTVISEVKAPGSVNGAREAPLLIDIVLGYC